MRTISADDLATIWPEAVVIDVRSAEEYATAHISGSRNIPLNDLTARLTDVPGTTVHVLCDSGKRSSQAARMLNERGYSTVNIAGGITEWYRNGHPVTSAPPATEHPEPAGRRPLAAALTRILKRTSR
jgi:rhodanese-related sulfurtransferase